MTFNCIICGETLPIEQAHAGKDGFATVCTLCHRKGLSERYLRLCPPAYLRTQTDLLPKVAQQQLPQIMAWEYGLKGLLLWGENSGTGKTRCAWLLLKRLMTEDCIPVAAFDAMCFTHELERRYRADEDVSAFRDSAAFAPILFMDDFAKCPITFRVAAELHWIIDYRTTHDLPIITTMNFDGVSLANQMKDTHGPYLVRRLREFCDSVEFKL